MPNMAVIEQIIGDQKKAAEIRQREPAQGTFSLAKGEHLVKDYRTQTMFPFPRFTSAFIVLPRDC
jgi:hypothetical protein